MFYFLSGSSSVGKTEFLDEISKSVFPYKIVKIVRMATRRIREKYDNPPYSKLLSQEFYLTANYQNAILKEYIRIIKDVEKEQITYPENVYIFERSPLDVVAFSNVFASLSLEHTLGFDLKFWLDIHKTLAKSRLHNLTKDGIIKKTVYFPIDYSFPYVEDVHRPPTNIREAVDKLLYDEYWAKDDVITKDDLLTELNK